MKNKIFAVLFAVLLFSGCGIKGMNTTMKVNGNERTFVIGEGWQYSFTAVITNGSPGTVAHVLVTRNGTTVDKATLRPGETYTEKMTSSMCYGNRGGYYSYSRSWNERPPEVLYKVNFYKAVGEPQKGIANAEFIGTLTNRFLMFDCQDPISKTVSWDIGGYWGQGGYVIR